MRLTAPLLAAGCALGVFAHDAHADETNEPVSPPIESEPGDDERTETAKHRVPAESSNESSKESSNAEQPAEAVESSEDASAGESSGTHQQAASTNPEDEVERRGGFVIGVSAGPSLGWASGNPSGQAKQNDSAFHRNTGAGIGYRVTPFLGAALTDWFTFGLGASFGSFFTGEYASPVITFVFHLEMFPLYAQGGIYRDIGLSADFGAGISSVEDKDTHNDVADSGAASTIGVGAFWEPLRFWHFAAGPSIGYQRNFSRWYSRNDFTVGLRLMFYGAAP